MGMKDRRKLEKKRRKERERARRAEKSPPLAYHGNKYKTKELILCLHRAEVGVYESFVMLDRRITDHQVKSALERLVLQLRQGSPVEQQEGEVLHASSDRPEEFILWNIHRNWQDLFEKEPRPSRDALVGVLRTILGSVETWSSVSPTSRGYLSFLEGFMHKTGVSVQKCGPDFEPEPEPEEDEEEELFSLGRQWCEFGVPETRADFIELAESLIHSGEGEKVVETCQRLIGEHQSAPFTAELSVLSIRAQQAMLADMQ